MVVSFLDANNLDALVYPTVRRKAAYIGEPQRGANCQLSAVSGLPALTMPAGFTPDGLPIGLEMLGRPLSDQKLVSFAYDYETATHPRRPPSTTPALVSGNTPAPQRAAVSARSGLTLVAGGLSYDAPHRTLDYRLHVTGTPADRVYAITIDRDSAGRKGPVLRVLSGPGASKIGGTVKLTDAERRELVGGHTWLVVYTADQPKGTLRAPLRLTP